MPEQEASTVCGSADEEAANQAPCMDGSPVCPISSTVARSVCQFAPSRKGGSVADRSKDGIWGFQSPDDPTEYFTYKLSVVDIYQ